MIGSPQRRITVLDRRRTHTVRLAQGRRLGVGASECEMRVLFTRLAEESERGSELALIHAAGVFGPDDDDPWVAAG